MPAYFKVPFTEALDLVATRRVYIEAGTAYVPFEHVVSILFAAFRANVGGGGLAMLGSCFNVNAVVTVIAVQLSKELSGAFRKYNRSLISKDDRLAPVLSNLAKHHIDADYSATPVPGSENAIRPDMIDGLAGTSMPLCMRSLHKGLKLNHHLKFAGRQQYGLFLKGIGLQLDDAIAYWKQEFCKKMSVDDFNKKYAYNIRHNYGKEGKRKDYAPSNCMRIITGDPPKNGEYHGCPFRHYEQEHLRKALQGVPEGDQQEILSLAENHHYQIACKSTSRLPTPEVTPTSSSTIPTDTSRRAASTMPQRRRVSRSPLIRVSDRGRVNSGVKTHGAKILTRIKSHAFFKLKCTRLLSSACCGDSRGPSFHLSADSCFVSEFLADAAIAQHGMILVDVHHFAHVLPNSHVSKNAKHHLRCSSTKRQQTIRGTRQRKYWEPPTRRTRRRSERKLCTLFSLLVCSASASLFSLGLRTTFTLVIRQQTTALVHSLKPYLCTATNVHVRTGSSFGPPRIFNISKKLMSPASIAMYCESSTKLSRWCCSQQTLHQNSLLQPHRFILLFTHHQVFSKKSSAATRPSVYPVSWKWRICSRMAQSSYPPTSTSASVHASSNEYPTRRRTIS